MNTLVKIKTDEYGGECDDANVWHLSNPASTDCSRSLCSGQAYGFGESEVVFESKTVERGGITCPECLSAIKVLKSVKL
jgi:hypothetical protein